MIPYTIDHPIKDWIQIYPSHTFLIPDLCEEEHADKYYTIHHCKNIGCNCDDNCDLEGDKVKKPETEKILIDKIKNLESLENYLNNCFEIERNLVIRNPEGKAFKVLRNIRLEEL